MSASKCFKTVHLESAKQKWSLSGLLLIINRLIWECCYLKCKKTSPRLFEWFFASFLISLVWNLAWPQLLFLPMGKTNFSRRITKLVHQPNSKKIIKILSQVLSSHFSPLRIWVQSTKRSTVAHGPAFPVHPVLLEEVDPLSGNKNRLSSK